MQPHTVTAEPKLLVCDARAETSRHRCNLLDRLMSYSETTEKCIRDAESRLAAIVVPPLVSCFLGKLAEAQQGTAFYSHHCIRVGEGYRRDPLYYWSSVCLPYAVRLLEPISPPAAPGHEKDLRKHQMICEINKIDVRFLYLQLLLHHFGRDNSSRKKRAREKSFLTLHEEPFISVFISCFRWPELNEIHPLLECIQ